MTPQQQIADLTNRIQYARRIVLDYREALAAGHVPSEAELAAINEMLPSITAATEQLNRLQTALQREVSFIQAAPNN